jgi:site-specific DNA-adenine methylase
MILNQSCLETVFPDGLMVCDPPYNQDYHYGTYKDKVSDTKYKELLSVFRKPCVVIGYPDFL